MEQERIPLHSALELALSYYHSGEETSFESILTTSQDYCDSNYEGSERDLMHILDSLAIHYTRKAHKTRDENIKREYFEKATCLFAKTDRMISYDQMHLLGRAYFYLNHGGPVQQAEDQFNFILSLDSRCIPALLAKGRIAFNRKEYTQALKYYCDALRVNPNGPAFIRLGIGLCYLKLGKLDKARLAFGRTLQLDSTCIGALVGLAILELNTKIAVSIKNGIELLSAAYALDPNDPMILNHLANHFFYKKDYSKVKPLAQHAFNKAVHDGMKLESVYHIARYYHAMGNYESAFTFYFQCTQFASQTFILPYYGLGQMYLERNDKENAINAFQRVIETYPDNYETLKILGCLYATSNNKQDRNKAKEYLGKVTELQPDDVEAWIELSQILEFSDPQRACESYKTAARILQENVNVEVPPEILNNIGALCFKFNRLEEAEKYLESALDRCGQELSKDDVYYSVIAVTVKYNIGRLYEASYELEKAELVFSQILSNHPKYVDCYFRLFSIYNGFGKDLEAEDYLKQVLSIDKNNCDAWVMLSNLYRSRNELLPAQNKLEHILQISANKDDSYAVIAMGNIWLEIMHIPTRDEDRMHKQQDRVMSFYTHILNIDQENIYAANGIGCVLAMMGLINEARDVFAQVREATADFPDVWLNIAHIYMEKKQYKNAIQMYENCITKFSKQRDIECTLYLARALYKNGEFEKCTKILQTGLLITPTSTILMFNLALTLHKFSMMILRDDKSNLRAVLHAVQNLQMSLRYFHTVVRTGDDKNPLSKRANVGFQLCKDLLSQTDPHIERARKIEEEEQILRRRQEEERKAIKMRTLDEANEKERQEKLHDQAIREQRAKLMEKTRNISSDVVNDNSINDS